MQVKKGSDRLVLVFPTLGIVVKFPVIRVAFAFRQIRHTIKRGRWRRLWYICTKWEPENEYMLSGMIFRGLISNQREYALWKRTRHPFLQPTLFSLFGILNVQVYGKPYESRKDIDLWHQIRTITKEEAYRDPHQFCEPDNYCMVNGKLRILDYGGCGTAWVVVKWGRKIMEEFDPEFRFNHFVAEQKQKQKQLS